MKILLAEDDPAMLEIESAYLVAAGHEVSATGNGNSVLSLFTSFHPDLVILDINLPGKDGLTICKQLRSQSQIPIILVTARVSDTDELRGLKCGADDYIKKPFNPNVLTARVANLLDRKHSTVITAGPFQLDPLRMTVHKHSNLIKLTTMQFNILYHLAAHPDIVFSRSQLVDMTHENAESQIIFERTIDAHIKSIRQRIEDEPKQPMFIQTIVGRGYRFNGYAA